MTIARPGSVCSNACGTPSRRSRDGGGAGPRDRDPGMYVDFAILADVSLLDRDPPRERAFQYRLRTRRTDARPGDRRAHHSDISDLDIRPGRTRVSNRL